MGENEHRGVVLALGALSVSAMLFFSTQIRNTSLERSMLEAQRTALATRKNSIQEGIAVAEEALKKREAQIQRVQKLESEYGLLLGDLLELAKVDFDAQTIAAKWKLQYRGRSNFGQEQVSAPTSLSRQSSGPELAPAKKSPQVVRETK